jgi:hypothetical protein
MGKTMSASKREFEAVEGKAERTLEAAPQMFELLRRYVSAQPQCDCSEHSGCEVAAVKFAARALIAKIEGKKP